MPKERYPGERRGLERFLERLLPLVDDPPSSTLLLGHAARRALQSGDLARLHHARRLFDHLPRGQRQRLWAAMLKAATLPGGEEAGEIVMHPAPVISFEADEAPAGRAAITAGLRPESELPAAVQVSIRPGTLPTAAAATLRLIATMIEADRRLLSERHWRERTAAEDRERVTALPD